MIIDLYKLHLKKVNLKNRVYYYYFDNLTNAKKIETKNILVGKKIYKDLVMSFAIYDWGKPIIILSQYYHKLVGKIEE